MLAQAEKRSTRPPPAPLAATDLVALWFVLAQRSWTSLAVVPADPQGSSEELVRSIVDVGKRLSDVPVTAITMNTVDALSARTLADLQRYAQRPDVRVPFQQPRAAFFAVEQMLLDWRGPVSASPCSA